MKQPFEPIPEALQDAWSQVHEALRKMLCAAVIERGRAAGLSATDATLLGDEHGAEARMCIDCMADVALTDWLERADRWIAQRATEQLQLN